MSGKEANTVPEIVKIIKAAKLELEVEVTNDALGYLAALKAAKADLKQEEKEITGTIMKVQGAYLSHFRCAILECFH